MELSAKQTEGFNKLPLMRELSAQLTEGEKSPTGLICPPGGFFTKPSGKAFKTLPSFALRAKSTSPFRGGKIAGGSKPPPYSSCWARFGTVRTVPYGEVITSLVKGRGTIEDGGGIQ